MEVYDLKNPIRNVINNFEIQIEVEKLSIKYPQFKSYIKSNVRNWLIKNLPCLTITESKAHLIYQNYFKTNNLNPEVVKSIENGYKNFHQLLISLITFKKVEDSLNYAIEEKIELKSSVCFSRFVINVNKELEKRAFNYEIREGRVEEFLRLGKNKVWVELIDKQSFVREGFLMKNCLKDNYHEIKIKKNSKIYSLRVNGSPKIDLEVSNGIVVQIKAVANTSHFKWIKEVKNFIEFVNFPVSIDSEQSSPHVVESLQVFDEAFKEEGRENFFYRWFK